MTTFPPYGPFKASEETLRQLQSGTELIAGLFSPVRVFLLQCGPGHARVLTAFGQPEAFFPAGDQQQEPSTSVDWLCEKLTQACTGEPLYIESLREDPDWKDWCERSGLVEARSLAVAPVDLPEPVAAATPCFLCLIRTGDGDVARDSALLLQALRHEAGRMTQLLAHEKNLAHLRVLEQSLASCDDAVFVTDARGTILWINEPFTLLTQYSSEEAVGKNPSLLKSGEHPPELYEEMWETITSGNTWKGKLLNRRKDGSFYHEELTISPVKDAHGMVTHFIGIQNDITKHMEAEFSLRRVLHWKAALLANSTAAIFRLDSERRILEVNEYACALFGYEQAELLGQKTEIFYSSQEAFETFRRENYEALHSGEVVTEVELVQKDGSCFWARISGRAFDPEDFSKGFVWVLFDISDTKRAASELSKTLEWKNALLNNDAVGICHIDGQRRITEVNDYICRITGYSRDEIVGDTSQKLHVSQEAYEELGKRYADQLARGNFTIEWQFRHKNGTVFWAFVSGSAIDRSDFSKGFVWAITDITDTKSTAGELAKALQWKNALFNNNAVGICHMSGERQVLEVNDYLCRLFGYEREEIVNQSPLKLHTSEESCTEFGKRYFEQLAKGDSTVEWQLKRKDGSLFWALFSGSAIDRDDISKGFVWAIFDITERKEAQSKLFESNRRYRDLFENNHAVQWVVEPESQRILDANPAACKFYGYTHEVLTTMKVSAINIAPPKEIQKRIEIARTNPNTPFLFRHRTANGRIRDVEVYAARMNLQGKDVVYSIILDVSERIRAEQALRESEEKFRSIFNTSAVGISRLDPKTKTFLEVNDSWCTITGYSREDLIGMNSFSLIHPDDLDTNHSLIKGLLEGTTSSCRLRKRILRKTGETLWIDFSVVVLRTGSGEPESLIGVAIDITESVHAEDQLRQARDDAEAANRSKSAFLATMSHEIRTPMNSVVGFGDLLLSRGNLEPRQREYVERINESGATLLSLIDNILDYSKLEAGGIQPSYSRVHIPELVSSVSQMLLPRATDNRTTLYTDTSDLRTPFVLSDALRLRQILTNLLSNAVKFTTDGEVTFRAYSPAPEKAEGENDPPMSIAFEVEDNGIGFDAGQLDEIFKPFTQADYSIGQNYGGTGLGLAITKNLVKILNGTIHVTSQQGEGSCFTVTIPVSLPDPMSEMTEQKEETSLLKPETFEGMRLLAVDDNPVNLELLIAYAESFGATLQTVVSGEEVLRLCGEGRTYDAIFVDIRMPGMDGYSLIRALRKGEGGDAMQKAFLIAFTAYALHGDREKCLNAGADEYLTKPIRRDDLRKVLARVCQQHRED